MIRIRLKRDLFGRILTDDTGSALILALAFLIFFSFVGAALLAFVDTAFRSSIAVKDQRKTSYAGDGGVEGAIRYIQADATRGTSTNCPEFVTNLNGATVTVRCSPYAGSGDPILGGAGSDSPSFALLALDDTITSDGLDQGSGGNLDIDGAIFSNSRIAVANGALLRVTGTVWAKGACDNARITPDCTPTTTVAADPQYPPQSTTFPLTNPPPVCVGTTARFGPGKYTSTPEALDDLSCLTPHLITTHEFLPGAYYFEFPGTGNAAAWTTAKKIIGGTPDPTDPNGCLTGVQFIFGAASHLDLQNNSSLFLCSKPPSGQRIAIYGAGSLVKLRPTSVTTSGSGGTAFTPVTAATLANFDSVSAMATMTASGQWQSLGGAGFDQGWNGGALASNGNISSAKIRFRHRESNNLSVSATVAPSDGTSPLTLVSGSCTGIPSPCATALTTNNSLHEDFYELTQTVPGWTVPTIFNGAAVTFSAGTTGNSSSTRTVELDGVWIDVVYAPSPFKAASGSVLSGADPLLTSPNTASFVMKVTGTVYSPASVVDIGLGNDCDQALGRGIISWRLKISLTGGCTPLKSPISLPPSDVIAFQPRQVLLEAFVGCTPGSAGCNPRVKAKVRFPLPASSPIVDYWTVLRR